MKVEELYRQESQIGVTLRRIQYETEVDLLPQSHLLTDTEVSRGGDTVMSELTSAGELTEERLSSAVKHMKGVGGDEFTAIPLKRNDSGAHQHRLQGCSSKSEPDKIVAGENEPESTHRQLMDEIDGDCETKKLTKNWEQEKPAKKESTLTRMFKGIRGEKDANNGNADKDSHDSRSIGKIFQNIMNPVGKTSRDNISKVLHRIGDAIQMNKDKGKSGCSRQLYRSKTSESERNRLSDSRTDEVEADGATPFREPSAEVEAAASP